MVKPSRAKSIPRAPQLPPLKDSEYQDRVLSLTLTEEKSWKRKGGREEPDVSAAALAGLCRTVKSWQMDRKPGQHTGQRAQRRTWWVEVRRPRWEGEMTAVKAPTLKP